MPRGLPVPSAVSAGGLEDMNVLITRLNEAMQREDQQAADEARGLLQALRSEDGQGLVVEEWRRLGTAGWLADRLRNLGFFFSTPCQSQIMKALAREVNVSGVEADGTVVETRVMEPVWRDMALQAPTGSGKTIAYLASALTSIGSDLYTRERDTFDAVVEEFEQADGSDDQGLAEDEDEFEDPNFKLARKMSFALSPSVNMAEIGTPMQSWMKQPGPERKPLFLVMCPSRELGAQVAMQIFQLVGGNVRREYRPADRATLFNYQGPRGVRIIGLLDEADSENPEVLERADIVVGTIEGINAAFERDVSFFDDVRVVAVDEADLTMREIDSRPALMALLGDRDSEHRRHILLGATLGVPESRQAVDMGILDTPLLVTPLGFQEMQETAQDTGVPMIPRGIHHRIMMENSLASLASLVNILRHDIEQWEQGGGLTSGNPRPRVVVFMADDQAAQNAAPALRNTLWGKHKIYALLPEEGKMPLQVMEQFAGAAVASSETQSKIRQMQFNMSSTDFDIWSIATAPTVLLTTPSAARGLHFSNLTHVYSVNVEVTAAEYAHQAGRLGRLGNIGAGVMTSIIEPDLEPTIRAVIDRVTGNAGEEIQVLQAEDYRPRRISLEDLVSEDDDVPIGEEDTEDLTMEDSPDLEPLVRQLEDLFELYGDSPMEGKRDNEGSDAFPASPESGSDLGSGGGDDQEEGEGESPDKDEGTGR